MVGANPIVLVGTKMDLLPAGASPKDVSRKGGGSRGLSRALRGAGARGGLGAALPGTGSNSLGVCGMRHLSKALRLAASFRPPQGLPVACGLGRG
jgi:hypothetical protein